MSALHRNPAPPGEPVSVWCSAKRQSENAAQVRVSAPRVVPVSGITQGDLLEVDPVGEPAGSDAEMTVNRGASAKAAWPIGRGAGAAPGGVARLARQHHVLGAQRIVIDQDRR